MSGSDVELAWLLALGMNGHHYGFLCVWRTGFLQGFQAIFLQLGHREVNELTNLILGFYFTSILPNCVQLLVLVCLLVSKGV